MFLVNNYSLPPPRFEEPLEIIRRQPLFSLAWFLQQLRDTYDGVSGVSPLSERGSSMKKWYCAVMVGAMFVFAGKAYAAVPEIDAGSAVTALGVLSGAPVA